MGSRNTRRKPERRCSSHRPQGLSARPDGGLQDGPLRLKYDDPALIKPIG